MSHEPCQCYPSVVEDNRICIRACLQACRPDAKFRYRADPAQYSQWMKLSSPTFSADLYHAPSNVQTGLTLTVYGTPYDVVHLNGKFLPHPFPVDNQLSVGKPNCPRPVALF